MKKYFLLCICWSNLVLAAVPTNDVNQNAIEQNTMLTYLASINNFINDLSKVNGAAEKVVDLNGIIQAQNNLLIICRNTEACSVSQQQDLHKYLASINNSIVSQFNKSQDILNKAGQTVNSLQEIIKFLIGAPANTKQAVLNLQQAALNVQTDINSTLTQVQFLLLKQSQKQQAEEQIELLNSNATYAGFAASGL